MFPRRPEFDQYGDAMSAYRWRYGGSGYYLPSTPPAPPHPPFHGYPNYHTYNNPSYLHATPPSQNHLNLYASQPPNDRFYSLQNNIYRTSEYNHWAGPVQPLIPSPVRHVHPAILHTQHQSFTQFPNYLSTKSVGQISHTKPSKLNPTVQIQKKPSNTAKKVVVSETKQAPNNKACTPVTPIAVILPAKESIQWPKPDIELVVKDIPIPVNETQEHALVPFSRKRKRKRNNKKNRKKVKKELPPEQTVEIQQNPSSMAYKVEVSESKQAPNNTACTPATPVAVTQPAKESIQWPKPDIELVVKDIANPFNETQVLVPFSRKRKRNNKKNRKEKVKKEMPPELMHYYRKHMVRDPWSNIKPVVGIIVKKWAVFSVIENKEKCEGGLEKKCEGVVSVDYSKMSLADCLEMTFEETVNGSSTVTEDQMYFV